MVGQSEVHFAGNRLGQAVLAEHDDWLQGMAQAAQVFFLVFRKFHGGSIRQGRLTHDESQQEQQPLAGRAPQR